MASPKHILNVSLVFNTELPNLFSLLTVGELMDLPYLLNYTGYPLRNVSSLKLLYVFKCLNDIAPPYLSDMFHLHQLSRTPFFLR